MAVLRQTVNLFPRGKQWWFESIPAHHNVYVAQNVNMTLSSNWLGNYSLKIIISVQIRIESPKIKNVSVSV